MLYHHSIHVASLVPVLPGVVGGMVMAIVSVAAAAGAVAASRGSLVGVCRTNDDVRLRPATMN